MDKQFEIVFAGSGAVVVADLLADAGRPLTGGPGRIVTLRRKQ